MKGEMRLSIFGEGYSYEGVRIARAFLSEEEGTPGKRFSLSFLPPAGCREELEKCTLWMAGKQVEGQVDTQKRQSDLLEVECRQLVGARLMDNEVFPESLEHISFSQLVLLHGGPFGVVGTVVKSDPICPLYTVQAGTSAWESISRLACMLFGHEPNLDEQNRITTEGKKGKVHILECQKRRTYFGLQVEYLPKERISHFHECSMDGVETVVTNPNRGGVIRHRYLRLPSTLSRLPETSCSEKMALSMRQGMQVCLQFPGFFPCNVGDSLDLLGRGLPLLHIRKCSYVFEDGASFTKIEADLAAYRG